MEVKRNKLGVKEKDVSGEKIKKNSNMEVEGKSTGGESLEWRLVVRLKQHQNRCTG